MDLKFGPNEEQASVDELMTEETPQESGETFEAVASNTNGMTEEEINDANKIKVEIADKTTPLVIFFGAPSCGKTMTLIRLARHLKEKGFAVEPVRSFRPGYDRNYTEICDGFDDMLSSDNAAASTNKVNFLLVKVSKNGTAICQILEGPGEYYFDPKKTARTQFPRYVNAIINCNNRRLWAIMTEPSHTNKVMNDTAVRRRFVDKIRYLKGKISLRDNVLFVYNKIDESGFMKSREIVNEKAALKNVNDLFPGMLDMFLNENPLTKWMKTYNCDFVPFYTGDFSTQDDGTLGYDEGPDIYPRKLWEKIMKNVRG